MSIKTNFCALAKATEFGILTPFDRAYSDMIDSSYQPYLRREVTTNGLTNAFFNAVICWYLIKAKADLTWWGEHSFGGDILATALILPWIVAMIVIPLQRRKVRKGIIQPWYCDSSSSPILRLLNRFPQSLWLNGIYFGLLGLLAVAPLTLLLLWIVGASLFTPMEYAIFKGLWAGCLAAITVLPMLVVGLRADLAPAQGSQT